MFVNNTLHEVFGSCVLLGDFNAKNADFNNVSNNSKFRYPVRTPNPRNISGDILTTKSNDLIILNLKSLMEQHSRKKKIGYP